MFRLFSIWIGYLFGNFLTAEAVARKYKGESAYDIGTGNPGMANIMSTCGFTAGVLTLAGDLLKTVIACVLCRFVLFPSNGMLAAAWAGLGVCLGHDFPFWHHFRGGRSVATTCAAIFCIRPLWGLLSMAAGMYVVFFTQYLSIGAVVIPCAFIPAALFWLHSPETALVALAMTLLMFSRHFDSLRAIAKGTEKKVNVAGLLQKQFGRFTILCIVIGTCVVLWFALQP